MVGKNLRKINVLKSMLKCMLQKYAKKEKTYPAYVSKYNSNPEKQIIPLMIPNGEGWYYLALKKLSALLRGITSKITVIFNV